jgi:hypothetical protein
MKLLRVNVTNRRRVRVEIHVETLKVFGREIAVHAVANDPTYEHPHYLIYRHGNCLNADAPFWRMPTAPAVEWFLRGNTIPDPRPPRATRRRRRCSVGSRRHCSSGEGRRSAH